MVRAAMLLKQGIIMSGKKSVKHSCYADYELEDGTKAQQVFGSTGEMKEWISINKINLVGTLKIHRSEDFDIFTTYDEFLSGVDNIVNLDASTFNTKGGLRFTDFMYNCKKVEYADLTGMNVSDAITVGGFFRVCENLKSFDVSTWTPPVGIGYVNFCLACRALETIDLSSWSVIYSSNNAFRYCDSVQLAYAKTASDAAIFNATSNKPLSWGFVPKP